MFLLFCSYCSGWIWGFLEKTGSWEASCVHISLLKHPPLCRALAGRTGLPGGPLQAAGMELSSAQCSPLPSCLLKDSGQVTCGLVEKANTDFLFALWNKQASSEMNLLPSKLILDQTGKGRMHRSLSCKLYPWGLPLFRGTHLKIPPKHTTFFP